MINHRTLKKKLVEVIEFTTDIDIPNDVFLKHLYSDYKYDILTFGNYLIKSKINDNKYCIYNGQAKKTLGDRLKNHNRAKDDIRFKSVIVVKYNISNHNKMTILNYFESLFHKNMSINGWNILYGQSPQALHYNEYEHIINLINDIKAEMLDIFKELDLNIFKKCSNDIYKDDKFKSDIDITRFTDEEIQYNIFEIINNKNGYKSFIYVNEPDNYIKGIKSAGYIIKGSTISEIPYPSRIDTMPDSERMIRNMILDKNTYKYGILETIRLLDGLEYDNINGLSKDLYLSNIASATRIITGGTANGDHIRRYSDSVLLTDLKKIEKNKEKRNIQKLF